MFNWLKKYIWGGVLAVVALMGMALAVQTRRNKTLAAEANGAKETAEKAAEQLETVNDAVRKSEDKRKEVLATEASFDSIKKETAAAVESAKEIEIKDTVRFGKWVLIFAVLLVSSGCATTLEKCRAEYPCPDNVCIEVTPPALDKLPRPELAQLAVSYDETKQGFLLTPEQIGALLGNERSLIETIKGYERIIDVYNSWRLKQ